GGVGSGQRPGPSGTGILTNLVRGWLVSALTQPPAPSPFVLATHPPMSLVSMPTGSPGGRKALIPASGTAKYRAKPTAATPASSASWSSSYLHSSGSSQSNTILDESRSAMSHAKSQAYNPTQGDIG